MTESEIFSTYVKLELKCQILFVGAARGDEKGAAYI